MAASLGSLMPAVLRHLGAYVEIAGEDARDAAATVARRLATLLLAAAVALVALLMFCVWLLALTWDGPWRAWVAAGLAVLFASVAGALAIPLVRRPSRPKAVFFTRVRHELRRDRELVERAMDGKDRGEGGDHVAG